MSEKIQKVLARMGLGSRRGIEELISQGRVSVNGEAAKLGDRIEGDVTVAVDGRVVLRPGQQKPLCRVLMYHKPEGELTTLDDPEDRPTVFDHLPNPGEGRWIYIGRLDINTSGLLLFTTDGELANALMHPSRGVERVYAARVFGEVSDEQIEKLTTGVKLEDGMARFESVEFAGGTGMNAWYHCTLREGRKREVRRLWEACGLQVSRLIRIKYAGIGLDRDLREGQWRELRPNEINILRASAGLEALGSDEIAAPLSEQALGKGALGRREKERRAYGRSGGGYAPRRRDGSRPFGRGGFGSDERREGFGSRRGGYRGDAGSRYGSYGGSGPDEDASSQGRRRSYGEDRPRRSFRQDGPRREAFRSEGGYGHGEGRRASFQGEGRGSFGQDGRRGLRSDDRRGSFHPEGGRGYRSDDRRGGFGSGRSDYRRPDGFERGDRRGRSGFRDGDGRRAPRRSFRRGY